VDRIGATMLLGAALVLAGCSMAGGAPLPTSAEPEGSGSEAMVGSAFLQGDEATGCVWLELDGGGRLWPVWPAGFTARWDPELTLLRSGGVVVAVVGDILEVGGGAVPAAQVDYPEPCLEDDPDPTIWLVSSVRLQP
jgi:hypothetical protein